MEKSIANGLESIRPLIDNASDLIQITSFEGHLNYVNSTWQQTLGYTAAEVYQCAFVDFVCPQSKEVWSEALRVAVAGVESYSIQLALQTKTGQLCSVEGVIRCLNAGDRTSEESPWEFWTLWRRVNASQFPSLDLLHPEAEILKALEKERELGELKSRFIAMVSHEFRTPLTTIQSAAELLEYYDWSESDKQERFQQIRAAVQHMTQLLEDVLLIGKADAQRLEFAPHPLDLVAFCEDLIAELGLVAGRHLLEFDVDGEVSLVCLDAKLLRQILSNLLSNATKYAPQGGSVGLRLDYQHNQIILQVSDQGIGIPQDDQEHLFEAFYRASNVGSIQGTGLGLAIVKKCVDLHKGQIVIESQVGVGTTFTVMLPLEPLSDERAYV